MMDRESHMSRYPTHLVVHMTDTSRSRRVIHAASKETQETRMGYRSEWTRRLTRYPGTQMQEKAALERGVGKNESPPHVRDGAIVVSEPFLRLFEVTTDDVDERIDRDLHCRIESVEVVHCD